MHVIIYTVFVLNNLTFFIQLNDGSTEGELRERLSRGAGTLYPDCDRYPDEQFTLSLTSCILSLVLKEPI